MKKLLALVACLTILAGCRRCCEPCEPRCCEEQCLEEECCREVYCEECRMYHAPEEY